MGAWGLGGNKALGEIRGEPGDRRQSGGGGGQWKELLTWLLVHVNGRLPCSVM